VPDRGWVRGARIVASAPWAALLTVAGAAAALLLVASVAHGTALAPAATLLGVAAGGGAAAYVLDEEAASVADATPTSRPRRVAWRLPLLALPAAVALVGLLGLDRLDRPTHWLRLVPLAAGALATGVGLAAVARRRGVAAPGDRAGTLAMTVTVGVVAADPLHRWVTVAPLGQAAHAGRSVLLWTAVVALCVLVTLGCSRDPGRARRRARSRRAAGFGTRST